MIHPFSESYVHDSDRCWRWLAAVLMATALFNTLAYVVAFAGPVLSSDYWYFLDAFVREVRGGTLDVMDFFVKRAGPDHAQPLKKLVLLVNVQLADLDLLLDALVGVGFAVVCLVLLERLLRDCLPARRADSFYAFSAAALAASLVTLNGGMVFGNSLVALEFGTYLAVLLTLFAVWRSLEGGSWTPYLASLVFLSLIADDTAMLATAVIVVCCALYGFKGNAITGSQWRRPLFVACAALLVHAIYLQSFDALMPRRGSVQLIHTIESAERIALLAQNEQWLAFFTIPLASTLAHLDQLRYWFPQHIIAATWVLAIIGALLHGMFWLRALRGRLDRTAFVAVALMLLLYAYVAGILYGRVSMHGAAYLNSPRYVFFYLLSNVAVVLMAAAEFRQPSDEKERGKAAAAVIVSALLLLQIPLSVYTWRQGQYVKKYQDTMADQLLEVASMPITAMAVCVPTLVVCQYDPVKREEAVTYLREQRLNVFSEQFRRTHGMDPLP